MRNQAGLTLIEVVVGLAITGLILGSIAGVLVRVQRVPDEGAARLTLVQELRRTSTFLRTDANMALSFATGVEPEYGTFYWFDFAIYPPTRRSAAYYWDDGMIYREAAIDGVTDSLLPLMRHASSASDVSFTITPLPHPQAAASTERLLTVSLTGTKEGRYTDPVQESTTLTAELRPEQLSTGNHELFFLHNDPTPPIADTSSQTALPLNATEPTAVTLFNYDEDRDDEPGLRLRKSRKGGDIDEDDPDKYQDWETANLAAPMTVDGRASLFFDAAEDEFEDEELITIGAWLLDYDPAVDTFALIISRSVVSFTPTEDWSEVSIHFRPTVYTLPAGHRLRVRLQVDGISEEESRIAYDTIGHLSLLSVPVQP